LTRTARSALDVALVTTGDPGRRTGGYLYNQRLKAALIAAPDGWLVDEVTVPEGSADFVAAALRSAVSERRPQVVILDSIVLPGAGLAAAALRDELGSRLIALMHMLPSDLLGDQPVATSAGVKRLSDLERQLLSAVDRAVAVSPTLGDALVEAGAPAERVGVIPPGRDGCVAFGTSRSQRGPGPRLGRPAPGPGFDPAPTGRQPIRFLTVANWSEAKGIHLVVEALARLPVEARLDLVGETGETAYAAEVTSLIARLSLEQRVRVHGSLEPLALAERYSHCDVFVLPSRSEGFGTVFAEAMSFGKPVIAARVGPLPWLVEPGCGRLVPPNEVGPLATAMEQFATDADLGRTMGEQAWRRAQRLPTWEESTGRFGAVVRELLELERGGA
jgi:glycosyltransferase involved in cell wall biosynthesis